MIYLYNFLQILCAPLLLLLGAGGLLFKKYRGRIGGRLGLGLAELVPEKEKGVQRIWIHALSVGEVRSAAVLLDALARHLPSAELVLSSTTRTGVATAREQQKMVRHLLPYPLDFWFSVRRFLDQVEPDLFVLVETDFWPNFLWQLHCRKIPAVLVNGRISTASWRAYRAARLFFKPLFSMFARLYMQTEDDARSMRGLGVEGQKVCTVGNLKYDAALLASSFSQTAALGCNQDPGSFLVVAGSTHPGEEEMVLRAFCALYKQRPEGRLVIAPRDIGRVAVLGDLVLRAGLRFSLFSRPQNPAAQVIILDVFGRLVEHYQQADLVFIGGSLVKAGGHNPLEAAVFGKPVLFGPHMDDFEEVERDLLAAGAALAVADQQELQEAFLSLAWDETKRRHMSERARTAVLSQSGSAERLVADFGRMLQEADQSLLSSEGEAP